MGSHIKGRNCGREAETVAAVVSHFAGLVALAAAIQEHTVDAHAGDNFSGVSSRCQLFG